MVSLLAVQFPIRSLLFEPLMLEGSRFRLCHRKPVSKMNPNYHYFSFCRCVVIFYESIICVFVFMKPKVFGSGTRVRYIQLYIHIEKGF